jgi:hypothetical protein
LTSIEMADFFFALFSPVGSAATAVGVGKF